MKIDIGEKARPTTGKPKAHTHSHPAKPMKARPRRRHYPPQPPRRRQGPPHRKGEGKAKGAHHTT
ncbi:MAG: hypothetical protein GY938_07455 [Ketobacter sp.]|nr:hypothetical protein [Ketobacter sp.]